MIKNLREIVDRIETEGAITPEQYQEIVRMVTADPEVTNEEQTQLNRLRDLLDEGKVRKVSKLPE